MIFIILKKFLFVKKSVFFYFVSTVWSKMKAFFIILSARDDVDGWYYKNHKLKNDKFIQKKLLTEIFNENEKKKSDRAIGKIDQRISFDSRQR